MENVFQYMKLVMGKCYTCYCSIHFMADYISLIVIRSLCQPEIGTQKGVSITVLMATVIFKLRRWCQHCHLTSSKWDMTSQIHVTSLKHADIMYDVRRQTSCIEVSILTHSWQGQSLSKCQFRISPDILNHTCTFSLTWSSVSHRTAGDRRE